MTAQIDIADILGAMTEGPLKAGGGLKAGTTAQALLGSRSAARGLRRSPSFRPSDFNAQAVRTPTRFKISGLRSSPSAAEEGDGRMSKFVADIQARLTIINQMIPSAKSSERRALQKERSDLETKLRKVTG